MERITPVLLAVSSDTCLSPYVLNYNCTQKSFLIVVHFQRIYVKSPCILKFDGDEHLIKKGFILERTFDIRSTHLTIL